MGAVHLKSELTFVKGPQSACITFHMRFQFVYRSKVNVSK